METVVGADSWAVAARVAEMKAVVSTEVGAKAAVQPTAGEPDLLVCG